MTPFETIGQGWLWCRCHAKGPCCYRWGRETQEYRP